MASPQTTQDKGNEFFGAVQIEISTDGISWVDVGAADAAVFTENLVISTLETQNAEDEDLITDQTGTIEFNQFEWRNENARSIMRNGIDTIENIAGTPVVGASQTAASGSWNYNKFIKIENQNGDGSIISVTSVTGGTDGLLTVDVDYYIGRNDLGEYGIFIIDSATVTTEAQDMVIVYDYTPNASTRYWSGGIQDVPQFQTRLTNTETIDGVSVTNRWVFPKTNLGTGWTFEFKKYNDEDTRVFSPVTINVKQDNTQDAGKRLYYREES